MTKPVLNSQISLGNIIQLAVILFAVAGGYFAIQFQGEAAAGDAANNTTQIAALEVRIRVLENRSARDSEQIRTLQRDIGEIKAGQRETNGLLRQLIQRGSIDPR